jgi:hypothetical protein
VYLDWSACLAGSQIFTGGEITPALLGGLDFVLHARDSVCLFYNSLVGSASTIGWNCLGINTGVDWFLLLPNCPGLSISDPLTSLCVSEWRVVAVVLAMDRDNLECVTLVVDDWETTRKKSLRGFFFCAPGRA